MLRASSLLFCACALLFVATSANAFITFNNDDDNEMQFSNNFFAITKVKCFGAVISENKDEDFESEMDVCVVGLVGGLIVLIGLYPLLIQQGAPAQLLRRQDQLSYGSPPQFFNPAEIQQQQAVKASSPSISQRLFGLIAPFVKRLNTNTQAIADSALDRFGSAEPGLDSTLYDIQQQVQQPQEHQKQ